MLTRAGFALLSASVLLLLSGIPTGNLFIVTLSALPIAFFFLSALASPPRKVERVLAIPERPVKVGDLIPVTVRYRIVGGPGIVELHQPVPPIFSLVDGNNLHLVPKRLGAAQGTFTFHVRATRRGRFTFRPMDHETVPTLGFAKAHRGRAGEPVDIEVRPRMTSHRRMARMRSKSTRLFPENDEARLGIQTTEFRDIREYVRGDPPRTINWKATAKMMSRAKAHENAKTQAGAGHRLKLTAPTPLVNEYEHEGKKMVWVFLDCAPYMRVGTSAENVFEAAVAAATASAHHYLGRGYRVGFSLFNHDPPVSLYPDVGNRQRYQVQQAVAQAETSTIRGELPIAVEEAKKFLALGRTLAVVVTRADLADETILAGLRRLRTLTGGRRRRTPVIVASPDPFGLLPDTHAGTAAARLVQRHLHHERIQAVKRLGVLVLHWDPHRTRFEQLLMKQGGTR